MDKIKVLNLINDTRYYSIEDLRYNQKLGIMLSKDEFFDFLKEKDSLVSEGKEEYIKKVALKTFNSKHCFYVESNYLLSVQNEYMQILLSDLEVNQSWLFNRNVTDILISRMFSEVEGTLRIENVPTTHKRIAEIHKSKKVTDKNDIIVKNMLDAISFIVNDKPRFNKENLRKLYNILSKECLPEELRLKDGAYYRDDVVTVGGFEGADYRIIDECMNSLFRFANDPECIKEHTFLLPYICHYYVLYIHPYFDYNGRTARMVSFWLSYIHNIDGAPYFMSEAINECKGDYYRAIVNTRNTNNDLTYFLGYIMETSIKYSFVYKNVEEIKNELAKTGDSLSSSELVYVKKLLVHSSENWFNYKEFMKYINTAMTRQGALRILNNLTDYGILIKSANKKGDTIYRLNGEMITYKYHE